MLIAFTIILGLDLVLGMLDAHHSANGISKGLFVEGNPWIVGIYGKRPTLRNLITFNLTQCAVCCIASAFDSMAPGDVVEHPLLMLSASMLAADCAHHVVGYIKARKFGA